MERKGEARGDFLRDVATVLSRTQAFVLQGVCFKKNIGILTWWHKPVNRPTREAKVTVGSEVQGQPGQLSGSVFKMNEK